MKECFLGDIVLSHGVEFTIVSDLNGASLQFTLTCISSGGPATTVTWTRDSVTITNGTETHLDNNITAQYTHTLTVTGRLPGLYTCTVANNKPSLDSAQLTVQGKIYGEIEMKYEQLIFVDAGPPPSDLRVTATANVVTVMWSGSGGDMVNGYRVYYHHPTTQTEVDVTDHFHMFTESNASQRVYTISVQALSQYFPSPLVGPITARGQSVGGGGGGVMSGNTINILLLSP